MLDSINIRWLRFRDALLDVRERSPRVPREEVPERAESSRRVLDGRMQDERGRASIRPEDQLVAPARAGVPGPSSHLDALYVVPVAADLTHSQDDRPLLDDAATQHPGPAHQDRAKTDDREGNADRRGNSEDHHRAKVEAVADGRDDHAGGHDIPQHRPDAHEHRRTREGDAGPDDLQPAGICRAGDVTRGQGWLRTVRGLRLARDRISTPGL